MNNQKELTAKVEEALEEIRPFLQADGGDVSLKSIKDGIVEIEFL